MSQTNRFEDVYQACLKALDDLSTLEQEAPFTGLRAAATRQLQEALADVVSSVPRWELNAEEAEAA